MGTVQSKQSKNKVSKQVNPTANKIAPTPFEINPYRNAIPSTSSAQTYHGTSPKRTVVKQVGYSKNSPNVKLCVVCEDGLVNVSKHDEITRLDLDIPVNDTARVFHDATGPTTEQGAWQDKAYHMESGKDFKFGIGEVENGIIWKTNEEGVVAVGLTYVWFNGWCAISVLSTDGFLIRPKDIFKCRKRRDCRYIFQSGLCLKGDMHGVVIDNQFELVKIDIKEKKITPCRPTYILDAVYLFGINDYEFGILCKNQNLKIHLCDRTTLHVKKTFNLQMSPEPKYNHTACADKNGDFYISCKDYIYYFSSKGKPITRISLENINDRRFCNNTLVKEDDQLLIVCDQHVKIYTKGIWSDLAVGFRRLCDICSDDKHIYALDYNSVIMYDKVIDVPSKYPIDSAEYRDIAKVACVPAITSAYLHQSIDHASGKCVPCCPPTYHCAWPTHDPNIFIIGGGGTENYGLLAMVSTDGQILSENKFDGIDGQPYMASGLMVNKERHLVIQRCPGYENNSGSGDSYHYQYIQLLLLVINTTEHRIIKRMEINNAHPFKLFNINNETFGMLAWPKFNFRCILPFEKHLAEIQIYHKTNLQLNRSPIYITYARTNKLDFNEDDDICMAPTGEFLVSSKVSCKVFFFEQNGKVTRQIGANIGRYMCANTQRILCRPVCITMEQDGGILVVDTNGGINRYKNKKWSLVADIGETSGICITDKHIISVQEDTWQVFKHSAQ